MNRLEARRYAHKLTADLVQRYLDAGGDLSWYDGPDEAVIVAALASIGEQHRRYGPKTTDHAPRAKARHTTPLFDAAPAGPTSFEFQAKTELRLALAQEDAGKLGVLDGIGKD